jgi:hypothetical protein
MAGAVEASKTDGVTAPRREKVRWTVGVGRSELGGDDGGKRQARLPGHEVLRFQTRGVRAAFKAAVGRGAELFGGRPRRFPVATHGHFCYN